MNQELITFITAAMPITEVRGAIPLALVGFKFSILKAFTISVIGNIAPIVPFLFFLHKTSDYFMHRWYWYNRLITWVFERARRKHLDHFHEWQWTQVALIVFVAIPLPMTGAWSGAVAAYILGIPIWRSVYSIFAGILISAAIVTIITKLGLFAAGGM